MWSGMADLGPDGRGWLAGIWRADNGGIRRLAKAKLLRISSMPAQTGGADSRSSKAPVSALKTRSQCMRCRVLPE